MFLPPRLPPPPRPPIPPDWGHLGTEDRARFAMEMTRKLCSAFDGPKELERCARRIMQGWDDEVAVLRKLEERS